MYAYLNFLSYNITWNILCYQGDCSEVTVIILCTGFMFIWKAFMNKS